MLNRHFWIISLLIGFVFAQDSSFTFQQNDYVNIQSASTIQPENAMTIECWVNPDQVNYENFDPIIQYLRFNGTDEESGFSIIYYEDMFRFIVSVGSGQNGIFEDGLELWPGVTVNSDTWTHIAGTYDSETGIAKIFKNGYEQDSFVTQGGLINWNYISDMDMKIGRSVNVDIGELDGYFSGSIDEVRLWNYSLEANQIQSTMCIPPTAGASFLMAYWSFNDGNDATISDLTGNGNNGTLVIGGEGYWDADVYDGACLGSCVDTVITSFPFYHLSALENNMGDDWSFQNYPNGNDYSYQINLPTQKSLFIDTCDPLTDFDTILAVKDTCGNPVSITEFDDGDSLFCPISSVEPAYYASIIDSITLQAGTYYLIVDGYSGVLGNYALSVGTLPEIVSSDIAEDDSYLEIRFSENMYTNATAEGAVDPSDFEMIFDQNTGGTATGINLEYIADNDGNPLFSGEDTIRFYITVIGESTGQELITIRTQNNASIFNSFGMGMKRSASITQSLSDSSPPTVVDTNFPDGSESISLDSEIEISLSEPLYNVETNELLSNIDLEEFFTLKYGDSLGIDIPFDIELEDDNTTIKIVPNIALLSDQTVYFNFSGLFGDGKGNESLLNLDLYFETVDNIPPAILTYQLAEDNSYVDLIFNDKIFGDEEASSPLEVNNVQVFIDADGSNVDSCFVTSVSNTNSNFLIGGEDSIRINLEYNGTPEGGEKISLSPSDSLFLYDDAGIPFPSNNFTGQLELNDMLPPSIDSISVPIDSFIVLMESNPIIFRFNEKLDSVAFTVSSYAMDTVKFSSILTDDYLQITLEPPFASYDSISIDFPYLEDQSSLTTVDIAYTYRTPILGDYDFDGKISYNDMWDLVENWEAKNFSYELGPAEGTVPHLISFPDSKFNIDDGMAFVQIWSWYQSSFGEIIDDSASYGSLVNIFQTDKFLSIPINDSALCGQIQFVYDKGGNIPSFHLPASKENKLYLNNHFPERGYSIIEFARSGLLVNDTIKIDISSISQGKLLYTFKNKNGIQKGDYMLNHEPLPKKLSLFPAYPNPFNPIATFKFDIPYSIEGSQNVLLLIYDVKGRVVDTLLKQELIPGTYKVKWYAQHHASGMYFAQLRYGGMVKNQKVIFLK